MFIVIRYSSKNCININRKALGNIFRRFFQNFITFNNINDPNASSFDTCLPAAYFRIMGYFNHWLNKEKEVYNGCGYHEVGAMFRVLSLTHLWLLSQMNSLCVTAIRSADLGMSSMHIWCTQLVQRNRSQRISFSVHRVAQLSRRCTISHQPQLPLLLILLNKPFNKHTPLL